MIGNSINIAASEAAVTHVRGIPFTPALKMVYFILRANRNEEGLTYTSQGNLCDMLGLSRPSVWKHIDTLIKMGLLTKSEQWKGGVLNYRTFPIEGA